MKSCKPIFNTGFLDVPAEERMISISVLNCDSRSGVEGTTKLRSTPASTDRSLVPFTNSGAPELF